MSAAEEAFEKIKKLREDARQLDREIIKAQENLTALHNTYHALQARIHQLMRENS